MSKCKLSAQEGRALVLTLTVLGIGVLLIPVFLAHASTNLSATRVTEEGLKEQYAADAGVEHALWRVQYDAEFQLPPEEGPDEEWQLPETINDRTVEVTISNEGSPIYKITSTATSDDESSTTIVSYVRIAESESDSSDSFAVFDYAIGSLDGDIDMGGSSKVKSDNYPELEGDVYANGAVNLSGSAKVYGDATAMGTINKSGSSDIYGEETEGVADPLVGPEVDTAGYKAEAQDVECAADIACGGITRSGDWSPPQGDYGNREHIQKSLSMSGSGTWIFRDTVCAGIDTNISGSAVVTFEGPVKVGRDLLIGGSGTVIFKGTVYVGRDLKAGGSKNIVFEGPVKVEGTLDISTSGPVIFGNTVEDTVCVRQDLKISSSGNVTFEGPVYVEEGDIDISGSNLLKFGDMVYVEGDLKASGSRDIPLEGTVYVCGEIDMSGSGLRGGQTVIAEGDITLTGSAKLSSEEIPFVISTDGDIRFSGSGWTSAIVYAPEGEIRLTGSNKVHGALVGKSVDISGSVEIEYPMELRDREDWSDIVDGGDDEGGELEILTYNINP